MAETWSGEFYCVKCKEKREASGEVHVSDKGTRMAKGVCPGCERPVDLKDPGIDFCPHCGIGLHDHCGACQTRKSAFAPFCHACGTAARGGPGA